MFRRLVIPTRRLLTTHSIQNNHQHNSLPNTKANPVNSPQDSTWFQWLATVAVASYTTTAFAQSESPPPPPPPPRPSQPQAQLAWSQLLAELRHAQRTFSLASGFTAIRRTDSTDSFSPIFSLEFPVVRGADLYSVLVSIASAFSTTDKDSSLHIEDSPTQTVLTISQAGRFEVAVSVPRLSPFNARVVIELDRSSTTPLFSQTEVSALVRAYCLCQTTPSSEQSSSGYLLDGKADVHVGPPTVIDRSRIPRREEPDDPFNDFADSELETDQQSASSARSKLAELGVEVFDPNSTNLTWDSLAGYEEVKTRIEDTLTFPLKHPEIYEGIVRGTRKRFESNVPKAVLYEGPPGCGKTLSAKILASAIGVPFVHVPVETILSKYYGETTRKLAEILNTANQLGRCIVFVDECDSLGMRRDGTSEMHEVTRRTLSVLLRHIDGMEGPQNTIVLAATNHKEDIDPALMSRFDVVVTFPLPDEATRGAILELYAKHLSKEDVNKIATLCAGFSGRELLDVCEEAERMHGGEYLREQIRDKNEKKSEISLPGLNQYEEAIRRKAPHVVSIEEEKRRGLEVKRQPRMSKGNPHAGPIPSVST